MGGIRHLLAGCTVAICFAVPAQAQSAADPVVTPEDQASEQETEIVVTARRREETLQSVPVAVSAISATQLSNNLTSDISKLGELAPQMTLVATGQGTGAVVAIRGVASSPGDSGVDQSVAFDIDDVPISRGRIMGTPLFDIASVQVLQGPQALFFGKNSPAGVISIRSADPTERFEGYVTAGYEFVANERSLEGAVSGPLGSTLAARLAFRASDMRGWIRNVAEAQADPLNPAITDPGSPQGSYAPTTKDRGARLTVRWEPSASFDARLKVMAASRNRNGDALEPFCIGGQTVPLVAGMVVPGGDCAINGVRSFGAAAPEYARNTPDANNGVPYQKARFLFGSLNLNKRFDRVTLSSTTGYYDQRVRSMNNLDSSPYALIWGAQREKYRLVTQELRASTQWSGPLNFTIGGYYEHSSRTYRNAADIFHTYDPKSDSYNSNIAYEVIDDDYVSAFAEAHWNVLPTLELSGGARWSHDKKSANIQNLQVGPAFPGLLQPGIVLKSSYSDSHISPEATLTWRPSSTQTLYVAYKTGYKAGGISIPFQPSGSATPDSVRFQPEIADGFEAGYKATLFDRRLRLDLSVYSYKYSDLQISTYVPPSTIRLTNAASSRVKGVQGSFDWRVLRDFTLNGNFGWNSARYVSYPNAPCYQGQTLAQGCVGGAYDRAGQALFLAPKLTFGFGGEYRIGTGTGWLTTLSTRTTHSSSYNVAADGAPGGFQKQYWLLNAAIHTGPESGKFDVALIGRNLTNKRYLQYVNGWAGGTTDQYVGDISRPREVMIQATVRW